MTNGTNRSRDVRFIICVFANGQTLPIFVLFGVKDSAKGVGNTDCLVLVTRPFHLTDGVGNTTTGYSPVTIRDDEGNVLDL